MNDVRSRRLQALSHPISFYDRRPPSATGKVTSKRLALLAGVIEF